MPRNSKPTSNKSQFYLLTFNHDWADEHDVPALACMTEKEFKEWKEGCPDPCAYLGNGGDGFAEQFEDATTGSEFIKKKYVKVTKVNEYFYKVFKKADLADLSLSPVFTDTVQEEEEEEEESDD